MLLQNTNEYIGLNQQVSISSLHEIFPRQTSKVKSPTVQNLINWKSL